MLCSDMILLITTVELHHLGHQVGDTNFLHYGKIFMQIFCPNQFGVVFQFRSEQVRNSLVDEKHHSMFAIVNRSSA